jgi:hypothetical protein
MIILALLLCALLFTYAAPALWAAPMTFPAASPISAGDYVYREQALVFTGTDGRRAATAESVGLYGLSHNITFIFEETPFQYNQVSSPTPVFHTEHSWGPGDISFLPRYTFWERDGVGTTNRLSLIAGALIPVGPHNDSNAYGRLPEILQPGTGAWATKNGLIFTRQTLNAEIDGYGGFLHHTASDGYRIGNEYFADDSLQRRIAPKLADTGVPSVETFLLLETNLIVNQKDTERTTFTAGPAGSISAPIQRSQDVGDPMQSGDLGLVGMTPNLTTGGTLLQFDPGIRFVGKNWGFAALAEIPGYQSVPEGGPERNLGLLLVYRHVWFTRHHL